MTPWIYVGLVALLLAAVPVTVWLKRAGDRAWAEHQRCAREAEMLRPIGETFRRVQIELVDNFTPALRKLGFELTEWQKRWLAAMYDENGRPRANVAADLAKPRRKGPTL